MFSWKFSWLTVLILICRPVFFEASSRSFAYTAFGCASDWLEPNVTVPPAEDAPPLLVALEVLPPHAASRAATPPAAPSPRPPRSTDRRLRAATDGGTRRARYSASDWGRDIVPPSGQPARRSNRT